MKKICILLFIVLTQLGWAQNSAELKTAAQKIYDAYYNMDFEAVAALSYPKIIEQLGGNILFTDKLDHDYQNDDFRKRLQLVKPIFVFGTIQKISGKSLCVISYKNPERYFFEKKLTAASATTEAEKLKKANLTNDVTFEPKRNSFNVRKNSKLIAVFDETTQNQWKFFNWDDPAQREVLSQTFSAEDRKKLGL
ncbi:hypothetical protein KIH23_03155 [Flavobacterium sp. CYK-55]|uniref:hypothetical protein n=1 Tax=Flavobacterium sp. CYK-55 TaxID=2835529 RepID=UPI001BCA7449|nr:hypothetical protein [Flavobacterium sp. CYK-55]MBS7786283.1 hypothetical protein [Flavobacterium sp. CYK-55]